MVVDGPHSPPTAQAAGKRLENRLLWRVLERYAVITEPVTIGPIAFEFTRVADPDLVLDQVALEEDRREKATGRRKRDDELHLPYWAELWESSLGLAHFIVSEWAHCGAGQSHVAALARQRTRPGRHPHVHVMDLGCGMGLAGVAAARLGMHVLFADLETPALVFARLNSLPDRDHVHFRKVNWQNDRLDERFDLVLGADIVYDRSQWTFLDTFFQAHLAPDGAVLIGEPGRSSGEEFEPWITARGWTLSRFSQNVPGKDHPIRLMQLTRK